MLINPSLLQNKIQHYAWGMRGAEAYIPKLLGIPAEPGKAYAELWMGAHPSAPSLALVDDKWIPLDQLIAGKPYVFLSADTANRSNKKLPFLFKVLSADRPLSIQAHPNKEQAEILHQRDPINYPDDNHKPEVAIALDGLTALVGFKSFAGIVQVLADYPELVEFIGPEFQPQMKLLLSEPESAQRQGLKKMYTALLTRSLAQPKFLDEQVRKLAIRLHNLKREKTFEEQLFLDLAPESQGDVGLFSIFFLNPVYLQPGQGVFIGPGIPHAYIKGNIIECMANSDNVVRAGLTSKFKDVATLAEILTYDTQPVPILEPQANRYETCYKPPISEFMVERFNYPTALKLTELKCDRPAIVVMISGKTFFRWGMRTEAERMFITPGQSVFIPANVTDYEIIAREPSLFFRAIVPPEK